MVFYHHAANVTNVGPPAGRREARSIGEEWVEEEVVIEIIQLGVTARAKCQYARIICKQKKNNCIQGNLIFFHNCIFTISPSLLTFI